MKQDMEQRMYDELDRTKADELVPGYDAEQDWQRLAMKLPRRKRLSMPIWARAAAVLLLVAVGGMWYMRGNDNDVPDVVGATMQQPEGVGQSSGTRNEDPMVTATNGNDSDDEPRETVPVTPASAVHKDRRVVASATIRNSTPCPIELRINQEMKCPNARPKPITSSSTVEPDQAVPLNFKNETAVAKNCSLTVKEIEIRSIATGEVILLDGNSAPFTAQEVFCYLTQEKQGDILAGVFDHDCERRNRKHNLRLDNRDGKLTLQ